MPHASSCERAAEPATSVAQRTVEVCGYRHCLRLRWWGKGGISSRPGRLIGQKKESEGLWEERNDVEDISPVAVSR